MKNIYKIKLASGPTFWYLVPHFGSTKYFAQVILGIVYLHHRRILSDRWLLFFSIIVKLLYLGWVYMFTGRKWWYCEDRITFDLLFLDLEKLDRETWPGWSCRAHARGQRCCRGNLLVWAVIVMDGLEVDRWVNELTEGNILLLSLF